jgi:2-dehydropantoate 2-reductase
VGGVAVYLGCQRLASDRVVRRPSRDPSTGRLRDLLAGGGAGPPGEALRAVGEAIGVPVRVDERYERALWTKLVANASLNTVTALGRARVGRVFADPAAVGLMLALGREVVAVARARGVPVAIDAAEAYVADARRRLPRDGGSSTLFDLEAGRRLERDALVGAVVREAARAGVPVPASAACDALLRLLDPG